MTALQNSAERIAQLIDELADERRRRDEMIVALVDEGAGRRDVARAARLSAKSVCTALAEAG